jgi:hypothetical protein
MAVGAVGGGFCEGMYQAAASETAEEIEAPPDISRKSGFEDK